MSFGNLGNLRHLFARLAGRGPAWKMSAPNICALVDGLNAPAELAQRKILRLADLGFDAGLLARLEREYAAELGQTAWSDADRLALLRSLRRHRPGLGLGSLQSVLNAAGFAVRIRENSPVQNRKNEILREIATWRAALPWNGGNVWGGSVGRAYLVGTGFAAINRPSRWGRRRRIWGQGTWADIGETTQTEPRKVPANPDEWRFVFIVESSKKGSQIASLDANKQNLFWWLLIRHKPAHSLALCYVQFV